MFGGLLACGCGCPNGDGALLLRDGGLKFVKNVPPSVFAG